MAGEGVRDIAHDARGSLTLTDIRDAMAQMLVSKPVLTVKEIWRER